MSTPVLPEVCSYDWCRYGRVSRQKVAFTFGDRLDSLQKMENAAIFCFRFGNTKAERFQLRGEGGFAPDSPTKDSAPGPRLGRCAQDPVIGKRPWLSVLSRNSRMRQKLHPERRWRCWNWKLQTIKPLDTRCANNDWLTDRDLMALSSQWGNIMSLTHSTCSFVKTLISVKQFLKYYVLANVVNVWKSTARQWTDRI